MWAKLISGVRGQLCYETKHSILIFGYWTIEYLLAAALLKRNESSWATSENYTLLRVSPSCCSLNPGNAWERCTIPTVDVSPPGFLLDLMCHQRLPLKWIWEDTYTYHGLESHSILTKTRHTFSHQPLWGQAKRVATPPPPKSVWAE